MKNTTWNVIYSRNAKKQKDKLQDFIDTLYLLEKDLQARGPEVYGWPHYGKLKGKKSKHYHCHLNRGKPRYVVVWEVVDDVVRILEIQYVGTHEKVNYKYF